jgi:putative ABC transport system permease protein
MSDPVLTIPLPQLAIAFVPVVAVLFILYRWSLEAGTASYALLRMLAQLLLIGFFLNTIFDSDSAAIVLLVLAVMVLASSWIALRTLTADRLQLYRSSLLSIVVGGGITLLIMSHWVLHLDPWYLPRYMIPLAGMIFANAMNSVSLAADRLKAELKRSTPWLEARNTAMHAAMIPNINTLFAVGLVSLPGMMTGQILSGISPLIAVRYQIMVMCMIFASAGISAALFLVMARSHRWADQAGLDTADQQKN